MKIFVRNMKKYVFLRQFLILLDVGTRVTKKYGNNVIRRGERWGIEWF